MKLPVIQPDRMRDLSSSAYRLWSSCARRFAFRYVEGLPRDDEDKPWFAAGRNKHEYCEIARRARDGDYEHVAADAAFPGTYAAGWAPDDSDDPEQVAALAAIQAWPERQWLPEVSIRLPREWGSWFGFSDQLGKNYVGDYKFTGNRKNVPGWQPYMKDAELKERAAAKLRNDIQVIVYGNAAPGGEDVDFQWTYVIGPEAKVLLVRWTMSREELREKLEALDRSASASVTVKQQKTPGKELPNYPDQACQGVGIYCDYVESCDLFNERGEYEMSQSFDDLLNEIDTKPQANPPESQDRDVKATVEEIPKTAKERKKKTAKKTAPKETLAGMIAFADARETGARTATIKLDADAEILVGARVELRLVG